MRVLIACGVVSALLAGGCARVSTGSTSEGGTTVSEQPASLRSTPSSGWADDLVRSTEGAYVVGWTKQGNGALWHVDAAGRIARRTAPPGMRGDPGLPGGDRVSILALDGARIGLAITGGSDDRRGRRTVYATDDAARTWTRVELPTTEQPVQVVVGAGAGYAVTTNCPRQTAPCDHATLWSIDPTGASAPHTFASLPRRTDTSGPISIAAHGEDVWVVLNGGAGRGLGIRSQDGGRSWRRFDARGCLWDDLTATSADVLWEACGTGMMQSFARASGSARPRTVFSSEVSGTSSSELLPLSDTTAFAVLDNGRTAKVDITRDGGRTTTSMGTIPRSIAHRGFRTTFVSDRVGYLVTLNGGEVYRTGDAGHSWRRLSPPRS